jgi:hypothetical protein
MNQSLTSEGYGDIHAGIVALLEDARRATARSVTAVMTASYWEIGRRIVEAEQGGQERAGYGERLIQRLADDLTARFGRGCSAARTSNKCGCSILAGRMIQFARHRLAIYPE